MEFNLQSEVETALRDALAQLEENSLYRSSLTAEIQQGCAGSLFPQLIFAVAGSVNPNYDRRKLALLAVSFQLSGYATTIFDDIIDADRETSLAQRLGTGQAFIIGLGAWIIAERKLLEIVTLFEEPSTIKQVLQLLDYSYTIYLRAMDGQYSDLYTQFVPSVERYLELATLKTAIFFEMVFKLTAFLAGGTLEISQQYATIGHKFGLLRQLKNDIESCFAPTSARNSLYNRLYTLPVLYTLDSDKEQKFNLLWQAPPVWDEVQLLCNSINEAGGFLMTYLTLEKIYQQLVAQLPNASSYQNPLIQLAQHQLLWRKPDGK